MPSEAALKHVSSPSRSEFLQVRGLRSHIRRWGDPEAPKVFLLHGLLDLSATFEDFAQALLPRFQVLAPDMRGFGESEWAPGGYWFQDYLGDLDQILLQLAPSEPLRLVGHSMGAQIASLYAGLRPERVRKLVLLDGLFLPDMAPNLAPKRFRDWLDELLEKPAEKTYASFEELAGRVRKQHPQLSDERALFVAQCWGREEAPGRILLRADPAHRQRGPGLYRAAESEAIWRQVTAETLFVDAGKSLFGKAISEEERQRRRACFRRRRVASLPQAGHMLHFDAPLDTARIVMEFLKS